MLRSVLFALLLSPLGCMTAPNPNAGKQNLTVGTGDMGPSSDGGPVYCFCCPTSDMYPVESDLGPDWYPDDLGPPTSDLGPAWRPDIGRMHR